MTNAAALKTDVTTTVADAYFNNDEIVFLSQNTGVTVYYETVPIDSIDIGLKL